MKFKQILGFLEEELHKFSYEIEFFDRKYILDKIVEFTTTINREAVRSNLGHNDLYSLIDVTEEDDGHLLNDGINQRVFEVPTLLNGVKDRETKNLIIVNQAGGSNIYVGRMSYSSFLSYQHARYSSAMTSYVLLEGNRLLIINFPSGFDVSQQGNKLLFKAILADQRVLCDTDDEILDSELKVASEVKLLAMIKKDILSLIPDESNKDNNERESG